MFAPAAGHLSDEELLKLAPMGPPDQIVTGAAGKLSDVGGKYCIQTLFVCEKFVLSKYGNCLDLHLSIQVSYYPNVSNWSLYSTMFMLSPCGHLSSKSGHLAIFIVCKSDHLASRLCPIDWTSSISCSCRATPGSVETLWEKGGTASNRPDGRC